MVRRKSVPQLVQEFAQEWVNYYLTPQEDQTGASRNVHTLKRFVWEHMDKTFHAALDAFMGIKRDSFSYNRVEIISAKEGKPLTVMEKLCRKAETQLMKRGEELLELKNFELKEIEKKHLQRVFREKLLYHLDEHINTLAQQRSKDIARSTLRDILMDDEWISLVEAQMKGQLNLNEDELDEADEKVG